MVRYKEYLGVTEWSKVDTTEKLEEYITLKCIFDQNITKLIGDD